MRRYNPDMNGIPVDVPRDLVDVLRRNFEQIAGAISRGDGGGIRQYISSSPGSGSIANFWQQTSEGLEPRIPHVIVNRERAFVAGIPRGDRAELHPAFLAIYKGETAVAHLVDVATGGAWISTANPNGYSHVGSAWKIDNVTDYPGYAGASLILPDASWIRPNTVGGSIYVIGGQDLSHGSAVYLEESYAQIAFIDDSAFSNARVNSAYAQLEFSDASSDMGSVVNLNRAAAEITYFSGEHIGIISISPDGVFESYRETSLLLDGTGVYIHGPLTLDSQAGTGTRLITADSVGNIGNMALGGANGIAYLDAGGLIPSALLPPDTVLSVNGYTGVVSLNYADVGAEPTIAAGTSAQYWRGDKTWQDLVAQYVAYSGSIVGPTNVEGCLDYLESAKEPSIIAGTTSQYWRGDKTWQTLNASAVGLGSVLNVAQEPALGNPAANGYVLASTSAGVRSWFNLFGTANTFLADQTISKASTPSFSIVETATGSSSRYSSFALGETETSSASFIISRYSHLSSANPDQVGFRHHNGSTARYVWTIAQDHSGSFDSDQTFKRNVTIGDSSTDVFTLIAVATGTASGGMLGLNGNVVVKVAGASGSFTSADSKTITVTNGIITSIA